MYRVLIVDDEPVSRNGIYAFIDWEKEGMQAEDDCANGLEALAALERCPFDILITDIKMPLMNGIQLIKEALELYPWLKVILISSYSDFEYVKEGLKLGAVDYLLKPTLEPEELLAVLRRCVSMLEDEREKARERNDYLQGAMYRERKVLEQEIKRLIVQGQRSSSSTGWAPAWLDKSYVCVYLMLDGADEWRENHGYLYVQLLLEEFQERFYVQVEEGAALLVSESCMFLIFPEEEGDAEQRILQWKKVLQTEREISTSVGFTVEQGTGSILKGFAESRGACQRRFFEGLGGLFKLNAIENRYGPTSAKTQAHFDWAPFYKIIRDGDPVSSAVEFALERWKSGALSPEQVKQEACSLLTGAYQLLSDAESLLPEQLDLLRRAETLEQLAALLTDQLEETGKPFIPKPADNGYGGQLITKALEYIADHYTENLTLQGMADIVHVSKSYFSLLFKKQTGRNFIDYLIELRIWEAKQLLAQNDSKIYDVAKAAGFKDVKYFSKAFKKGTGFTPMEYREKHQSSTG